MNYVVTTILWKKASKPKSQVKAMVDYFNRNPIPPPPIQGVM